ncbi:hypothetical protein D934_12835 [Xylella fastidiosa subsp. sandyi Ann-1]|uniref:Uncharacterized protein n=1 Tax=Xylella fastidiosa subsp. sandyi Ann-1 TaxID=155920 RepID=A0A060HE20_XYLFS|nr:hypothetical protein D934_12835 [Xylella fastidiosa subsp. sandyi Ann-1]
MEGIVWSDDCGGSSGAPCRSAVSSALEKRRPLQRLDALHERI